MIVPSSRYFSLKARLWSSNGHQELICLSQGENQTHIKVVLDKAERDECFLLLHIVKGLLEYEALLLPVLFPPLRHQTQILLHL